MPINNCAGCGYHGEKTRWIYVKKEAYCCSKCAPECETLACKRRANRAEGICYECNRDKKRGYTICHSYYCKNKVLITGQITCTECLTQIARVKQYNKTNVRPSTPPNCDEKIIHTNVNAYDPYYLRKIYFLRITLLIKDKVSRLDKWHFLIPAQLNNIDNNQPVFHSLVNFLASKRHERPYIISIVDFKDTNFGMLFLMPEANGQYSAYILDPLHLSNPVHNALMTQFEKFLQETMATKSINLNINQKKQTQDLRFQTGRKRNTFWCVYVTERIIDLFEVANKPPNSRLESLNKKRTESSLRPESTDEPPQKVFCHALSPVELSPIVENAATGTFFPVAAICHFCNTPLISDTCIICDASKIS